MWFLVTVEMQDGDSYRCVADASSTYYAEKAAIQHYKNDGHYVDNAEAEMFNTFEHGDISDYTVVD
ncbi:hypothetical protein UFOVP273_81 [uncultured Caudovirales phage]|uniref:Uncharacterized protein n=1 Tax=uncultured Caudovirales phage TaxID=2100421 RepID=A0A6J5LLT6_9CAUD|nr:hypothetical protein UFOVP273_81 [uncultured Caudovirales phage]